MPRKFTVYLSHSWRPHDVDLNLWVWERLAEHCDLLVDKPDGQTEDPPYFVNRLEEIMRRSDVFVSILTFRENPDATAGKGDYSLKCSAVSLFEVRLAERARKPRLILYERTTGFRRPAADWPGEAYIPFDRGAEPLPEGLDRIERDLGAWLEWVDSSRKPGFLEVLDRSVILLPESAALSTQDQLNGALQQSLFSVLDPIKSERSTDAALIHRMLNAGLIVADVTSDGTRELYAMAHTLFVPTIRVAEDKKSPLPWILEGHPGGYQHDIVFLSDNPWPNEVAARANAIFRVTQPLGLDAGRGYIKSRRYKGIYVFLSHNLRPGNRAILDLLIQLLRDEQIEFFEYYRDNQAGIEWEPRLDEALAKATLFAGLLADGYEDSPVCLREWGAVVARKIQLLPFLVNGRTTRTNLTPLHNQTLDSPDPAVNAKIVFDRIKSTVTGAL
jgi:hypothetical protein